MCKHPDTLTAEELSTYQPGWDCNCPDFNPIRCSCGANWTPREVYELRNMVQDLENQLGDKIEALDLALTTLARAENALSDLRSSARELENAWKRNAELEDYISGISRASSYMIDKETRRAMFSEASKYAAGMASGQYHYDAASASNSNYALEA